MLVTYAGDFVTSHINQLTGCKAFFRNFFVSVLPNELVSCLVAMALISSAFAVRHYFFKGGGVAD